MAKRWYSVSVLSNFEKKIAEQIRTSVAEQGLEDDIDEVLVPTEEVIEVRRGKKVTTERRFMPGYVLVHMEMSDQGYHLVNSINRVTGFLGPQGRPMPMRDGEVEQILGRVEEGESAPRQLITFEVGERVKVNGGPFEGFGQTHARLPWIAGRAPPSPIPRTANARTTRFDSASIGPLITSPSLPRDTAGITATSRARLRPHTSW